MTEEKKPHKWQKEIVAWAGGTKVEQHLVSMWKDAGWEIVREDVNPEWNNPQMEFRIHDYELDVDGVQRVTIFNAGDTTPNTKEAA